MNAEQAVKRILQHYEERSELYTNDGDLAFALAQIAASADKGADAVQHEAPFMSGTVDADSDALRDFWNGTTSDAVWMLALDHDHADPLARSILMEASARLGWAAEQLKVALNALTVIADVWTLPNVPSPSGRKWHCQHEELLCAAVSEARKALGGSNVR